MSVIVDLTVPETAFELGRILSAVDGVTMELETVVPLGDHAVPLVWVEAAEDDLTDQLSQVERVRDVAVLDEFDDETLYKIEWNAEDDELLGALRSVDGYLLRATRRTDQWQLELRFASLDSFTDFAQLCEVEGVAFTTKRLFHGTEGPDDRGGLTEPQWEALTLALERGYFDIPRRCSTEELGEELGISDQAVTERLRRGTATLIRAVTGVEA